MLALELMQTLSKNISINLETGINNKIWNSYNYSKRKFKKQKKHNNKPKISLNLGKDLHAHAKLSYQQSGHI